MSARARGGGLGEGAARGGRAVPDPYPDEPRRGLAGPSAAELPGERMTRTVARVGAGAVMVGAAGIVVYGLRSLRDLVRS